jgi:hypothetical protein
MTVSEHDSIFIIDSCKHYFRVYNNDLHHSNLGYFVKCVTSYSLVFLLSLDIYLLQIQSYKHTTHVAMNRKKLCSFAFLYKYNI